MTPGMVFRIQHSLVRQWIQVRRHSTRLVGKFSHGCSSWTRLLICPVIVQVQGDGPDSAQFVQFLDKVIDMPVVSNDRCFGFKSRKTVEVPQFAAR